MTRDELIREMKSAMQASPYHDDADAALTAIEAAGYAVVPKQANTEMVIAGQETFLDNGYTHGELHDGTLKKAYAAMIAAAQTGEQK